MERLPWICVVADRKIKEWCEQNSTNEFYSEEVFPEGLEGSTYKMRGALRALKARGMLTSETPSGSRKLQWTVVYDGE